MGLTLDQAAELLSSLQPDTSHVGFNLRDASPPTDLFVTEDDSLEIMAVSHGLAMDVLISFRHVTPDGQIRLNTLRAHLAAVTTPQVFTFPLAEGYLFGLTAYSNITNLARGMLFVQVKVVRGVLTTPEYVQVVLSDYVTDRVVGGYPWTIIRSPIEGPGWLRMTQGTIPGAGAEVSETVPGYRRWRLIGIRFNLTTSATVANRSVSLLFSNGAFSGWRGRASVEQPASTTYEYNFSSSGAVWDTAALGAKGASIPLPIDNRLVSPHVIQTFTNNLQPGDQFGQPVLIYEQWADV